MPPTVFEDLDSLLAAAPADLGCSEWYTLPSSAIEAFAEATGGPPPGPDELAAPMMALALTNYFMPHLLDVRGASSGINYGTESVRFNAPARAGDRLRASAFLLRADEVPGGVQTTVRIRVEIDGSDEPACVVDSVSRWLR